ncbi:MAG: hypothetical protein FWC50_11170 [Planctomycetaceae bacterium]|nr:hypothetical protein [Planctomycetaceae bacterium]
MREEELKNRVAHDYFGKFDCTRIMGNVDFCVCPPQSQKECSEPDSLLWAEAKKGASDIYKSIVQLILTIGKARTFDKFHPPAMLGAFDAEKIAFIPYNEIHNVFYQNDFNWKVAPSNHETREFKRIYEKVRAIVDNEALLFHFSDDDRELKTFVKNNFVTDQFGLTKSKIDKNNFIAFYNKWLQAVKPTIAVHWDVARKNGIIDGDFYLADLLSHENTTLKEKLFVLLKNDHYELDRKIDDAGMFSSKRTDFNDGQVAHTQFWNRYERPPLEEYWDYIVERRDLLVPQDIRERKGSFFTPQIWVELSQKYIADVLGENWQDEYYVWDCAAGTGNLLVGLTNKYNIWASTLDKADVDVMRDRIDNGANLLKDHVFQFDFLNDDFSKLPKGLQDIINFPKRRTKLIVYINPPYAEVSTKGGGKAGVNQSKIHSKYTSELGTAGREVYSQFLTRIYHEIDGCILAEFSKLKSLQGPAFEKFRSFFQAKLKKMVVVPANTFDNVKGSFPIGFKIWDTGQKEGFRRIKADVYNADGKKIKPKSFYSYDNLKSINEWISSFKSRSDMNIGFLRGTNANDFPHKNIIFILNDRAQLANPRGIWINQRNLIPVAIYFAVRQCLEATWLNDRDQFLHPGDVWETDKEFQNDCLAFTLFHGQNCIQSEYGVNHWIPFTETEVEARTKFKSSFMTDFIAGKIERTNGDLFSHGHKKTKKLVFSPEAKAVFKAGRKLWTYYHAQPKYNVNASLYDIREHFQGRNDEGKMNNKSDDETYNKLIGNLRSALNVLAKKIEPKVYEYGFLRK